MTTPMEGTSAPSSKAASRSRLSPAIRHTSSRLSSWASRIFRIRTPMSVCIPSSGSGLAVRRHDAAALLAQVPPVPLDGRAQIGRRDLRFLEAPLEREVELERLLGEVWLDVDGEPAPVHDLHHREEARADGEPHELDAQRRLRLPPRRARREHVEEPEAAGV